MTYEFRPAERSQAKPLIGLYSQSGAGKTYSALLLARGFVGPQGVIGMIETESGRGEAYADPGEYPEIGGYQVLSLRDNFSPETYGEAITAAEQANVDALIIDSASHEWEGTGGVLSMAADAQANGKKGPLVWQQPKIMHKRHFMLRFMQTSIPLVILCMRAKYPMREVVDARGRKNWARLDDLHPIQADDILFEMFVHGWISQSDHKFHLTKCTAKSLEPVFAEGQIISLDTGRHLAAWAQAGNGSTAAQPAHTNGADPVEEAKAAARDGKEAFQTWWNGPGRNKRAAVKPHMAEVQSICEQADANAAEEEDPFGFDAGEEAQPAAAQAVNGNGADMLLNATQSFKTRGTLDAWLVQKDTAASVNALDEDRRAHWDNHIAGLREALQAQAS